MTSGLALLAHSSVRQKLNCVSLVQLRRSARALKEAQAHFGIIRIYCFGQSLYRVLKHVCCLDSKRHTCFRPYLISFCKTDQICIDFAYTEWAKNLPFYFCPYLGQLLTDFQNYFTGTLRRQ